MSADINTLFSIPRFRPYRPYLAYLFVLDKGTKLPLGTGHSTMRMYARMGMSLFVMGYFSKCGRSRKPEANAIHFLIGRHGPHQMYANLILAA